MSGWIKPRTKYITYHVSFKTSHHCSHMPVCSYKWDGVVRDVEKLTQVRDIIYRNKTFTQEKFLEYAKNKVNIS